MRKLNICAREETEKLELYRRKPAPDQVSFTDSVTVVTDSELKLPLF